MVAWKVGETVVQSDVLRVAKMVVKMVDNLVDAWVAQKGGAKAATKADWSGW